VSILSIASPHIREAEEALQFAAADPAIGLVVVEADVPPVDPRELAWLERHCGAPPAGDCA
jgi:hypothetical protein